MTVEKKSRLYARLDQAFRLRIKGNASTLAKRLGISRSTFFRCKDEMTAMGAPIAFDESSECYYYKQEGRFRVGFLSKEEVKNISGGQFSLQKKFLKLFSPVSIFETLAFYV